MINRRNTIYLLIIAALLAALFTGRAFFLNVAYLLGGLLIFSLIWSSLSVRWITISRKTRSRRAQVGRNLEEAFAVRNGGWIPKLWVEIRDHSTFPNHRASHVAPALMPGSTYRWYVETPCRTRGEFQLGPMTVLGGDPFGLFQAVRKIPATSRVIVYPATLPIDKIDLPMGVLSGGEAQRTRSQQVTTNAAGVREYTAGDSFNRIHWATTARRDRLMVKEFEIDPMVDIWLFVDFSSLSLIEDPSVRRINGTGPVIPLGSEIPASTEEYAVVIAASLARFFVEAERALGFAAYIPQRDVLQPERGNRQLMRILQSLAAARSFSPYTLREMLTLETPYFTRGTTLVIITASLDTAWIAEAQVLARRGIRPMGVIIDPVSFGGQGSTDEFRALMKIARIPSILIRRDDDLSLALAQRAF
ncbi:MAG: DUF58 domain-containing protein [bacterium]|nr:DUF58 domain-containing protein [bacterium]